MERPTFSSDLGFEEADEGCGSADDDVSGGGGTEVGGAMMGEGFSDLFEPGDVPVPDLVSRAAPGELGEPF